MPVQRLRVTYRREGPLKFLSLLDMQRLWVRAFRRADVPLAYTEGFSPRPRFSIAAALPVGVTGEAELMDVYLTRRIAPFFFARAVNRTLPQGVEVIHGEEVEVNLPSLQALTRSAEYRVIVETSAAREEVEDVVRRLLARSSLPWEQKREGSVRHYDLRPLVEDVRVEDVAGGRAVLFMRLKMDMSGAGRAEQVTAALGFAEPPLAVHRVRLILAKPVELLAARHAAPMPSSPRADGPDDPQDDVVGADPCVRPDIRGVSDTR
ncbi:MAG: TIGR03936 family radical SAM-associated protein [Chloroflexota bacterium]